MKGVDVFMLSRKKSLNEIDIRSLRKQYKDSICHVKDGIAADIFQKGGAMEKKNFAEAFFVASITGKRLMEQTNDSYDIPDVVLNSDDELVFNVVSLNTESKKGFGRMFLNETVTDDFQIN